MCFGQALIFHLFIINIVRFNGFVVIWAAGVCHKITRNSNAAMQSGKNIIHSDGFSFYAASFCPFLFLVLSLHSDGLYHFSWPSSLVRLVLLANTEHACINKPVIWRRCHFEHSNYFPVCVEIRAFSSFSTFCFISIQCEIFFRVALSYISIRFRLHFLFLCVRSLLH